MSSTSPELVKLYYRIGEVARIVGVQPHVLRYWESEFPTIRPQKSSKGQRIYSRRDVEKLLRVKDLLRNQGFTIAGAKRRLGRRHQQPEVSDASPSPGSDQAGGQVGASPAQAASAGQALRSAKAPNLITRSSAVGTDAPERSVEVQPNVAHANVSQSSESAPDEACSGQVPAQSGSVAEPDLPQLTARPREGKMLRKALVGLRKELVALERQLMARTRPTAGPVEADPAHEAELGLGPTTRSETDPIAPSETQDGLVMVSRRGAENAFRDGRPDTGRDS